LLKRFVSCAGFLASLVLVYVPISRATDQPARSENDYVGSQACAKCHSQIYDSYKNTAMAKASGPASDNLIPADFVHRKSGVHYRIFPENRRVWLTFERPGDPLVRGKRELLYYIGSGRRGRSYLFATDGFLFESPINWYANKGWDMAPAYQEEGKIPLNLPTYTSCLHCHVTGMKAPNIGTENRYSAQVFSENGVGCERCHGSGAAHIKGGPIINPAKLSPERRDSVCMQCHLEGKVAIERFGRHVYNYRPGDNLSDYIRYYVLESKSGLGAVSQVEALAQSRCKKKAGDAMSCTTCHDPHSSPPSQEKVSFYRGKCLSCHGTEFGTRHHPDQPDCTSCHMPSSQSDDVAHTQVTDHRIPRSPSFSAPLLRNVDDRSSKPRLVSFPATSPSSARDLALAWQSLVESGMTSAEHEAERMLRLALKESPNDPSLLGALGYIEQKHGNVNNARELYRKALTIDPNSIDIATNLGVLEAREGHLREAVKLWDGAFQHAPGKSRIGMNLAKAFCATGQIDQARTFVLRVLEFDPDLEDAKQLLKHLNRTPPGCLP
jgi:hypothetical protein